MEEQIASLFEALGHPTRLLAVQKIASSGGVGMTVSEIQAATNSRPSTLSHHLGLLKRSGIVYQVREGPILRCYISLEMLAMAAAELADLREARLGAEDAGPAPPERHYNTDDTTPAR